MPLPPLVPSDHLREADYAYCLRACHGEGSARADRGDHTLQFVARPPIPWSAPKREETKRP